MTEIDFAISKVLPNSDAGLTKRLKLFNSDSYASLYQFTDPNYISKIISIETNLVKSVFQDNESSYIVELKAQLLRLEEIALSLIDRDSSNKGGEDYDSVIKERDNLRLKVASLNASLAVCVKGGEEQSNTIVRLNAKIEKYRERWKAAVLSRDESKAAIADLSTQLARKENECIKKMKVFEKDLEDAETRNEKMEKEIRLREGELKTLEEDYDNFKTGADARTREMREARERHDREMRELNDRMRLLTEENQRLRIQIDDLSKQGSDLQAVDKRKKLLGKELPIMLFIEKNLALDYQRHLTGRSDGWFGFYGTPQISNGSIKITKRNLTVESVIPNIMTFKNSFAKCFDGIFPGAHRHINPTGRKPALSVLWFDDLPEFYAMEGQGGNPYTDLFLKTIAFSAKRNPMDSKTLIGLLTLMRDEMGRFIGDLSKLDLREFPVNIRSRATDETTRICDIHGGAAILKDVLELTIIRFKMLDDFETYRKRFEEDDSTYMAVALNIVTILYMLWEFLCVFMDNEKIDHWMGDFEFWDDSWLNIINPRIGIDKELDDLITSFYKGVRNAADDIIQ